MAHQQNPDEVAWLLPRISGIKSILEIGSSEGGSLRLWASVAAPGAKLRSIDVCHDPSFDRTQNDLRAHGFDVEQFIADSTTDEAVEWAKANAPFEFIFIDGAHGVEAICDFANYQSMATRFIALHDINAAYPFVLAVWQQCKSIYKTEEVHKSPDAMGIGLVKL